MDQTILHHKDTTSSLFISPLSGSVDGIMQAEHSYLSGLVAYSCDEITS